MEDVKVITAYTQIPYNVFSTELEGTMNSDFQTEVNEISKYYDVYRNGADFSTEGSNNDYAPSNTHYKKIKDLIDKEARFLFSIPPSITVNPNSESSTEAEKEVNAKLNEVLQKLLSKTEFNSSLVKAARDCFIGKRVACMLNFNEEGISATFLNSTEFLYQYRNGELSKFVAIFVMQDSSNRSEQIIKKKVYEMGEDGFCYVEEALYSGTGEVKEEGKIERTKTLFQRIPAVVILNDGLSNEGKGCSDVKELLDYESLYSKMSNADIDSERKSMNPIRYAIDASDNSTQDLSTSPGSFWDIQSNQQGSDPKNASVGMLESKMSYSGALKVTLDRIENTMFSALEIPNINSEKLQGVITSGKTLKALYWSLIVRCNEKMLVWEPALRKLSEMILEGAAMYPDSLKAMDIEPLQQFEIKTVLVENNYPLPEDEIEEKTMDLAEVGAQVMSRKAYMKKWRGLTDTQVDAELKQIALERQMLEDSFMPMIQEEE